MKWARLMILILVAIAAFGGSFTCHSSNGTISTSQP
jgi:hypothetical protein